MDLTVLVIFYVDIDTWSGLLASQRFCAAQRSKPKGDVMRYSISHVLKPCGALLDG